MILGSRRHPRVADATKAPVVKPPPVSSSVPPVPQATAQPAISSGTSLPLSGTSLPLLPANAVAWNANTFRTLGWHATHPQESTPLKGITFVHVGKSGGMSLQFGLKKLAVRGAISSLVQVHGSRDRWNFSLAHRAGRYVSVRGPLKAQALSSRRGRQEASRLAPQTSGALVKAQTRLARRTRQEASRCPPQTFGRARRARRAPSSL